jgi:hypothetical protein
MYLRPSSYRIIVVIEFDVPRTQPVAPHKLLISWRALVLGVAGKHTLNAHAYALNVLDGTPALLAQEIKADDTVRVYVRMHRNWTVRESHEGDLWWLCWNQSRDLIKTSERAVPIG